MTSAQLPLSTATSAPSKPMTPAEIWALTLLQAGPVHVDTQSSNGRKFREGVRLLRLRGFLIASSSDHTGYELTTAPDLLDATESDLRAKALAILRVYRQFRRARQRIAA